MATDSARPAPAGGSGNVYLVGLMGAGKTSVGKLLARRLGKVFYDCDLEIERATGVRVPVIFEIEGEPGFRAREQKTLAELVQRSPVVLATGGGAVLAEQNRKLLKAHGRICGGARGTTAIDRCSRSRIRWPSSPSSTGTATRCTGRSPTLLSIRVTKA
jgi:shikimate kinase